MNRNILIVASHPDDETLGCGGTILKHITNNDNVYWLILTNISEKYGWDKEIVLRRQNEIDEVAKVYNFTKIFKLGFPTKELDEIPIKMLIERISKVINEIKPNTIYIQNRSDVHTDHQIAFKAVYSCTKNFRYPFIKRILMYETLSETEFAPALLEYTFIPNVFIDITEYFNKKIDIIKIYKSEVMNFPLPRSLDSIEALARYRGSRIGVKYAEAFTLLFEIL